VGKSWLSVQPQLTLNVFLLDTTLMDQAYFHADVSVSLVILKSIHVSQQTVFVYYASLDHLLKIDHAKHANMDFTVTTTINTHAQREAQVLQMQQATRIATATQAHMAGSSALIKQNAHCAPEGRFALG
jgi:hypothetical protein